MYKFINWYIKRFPFPHRGWKYFRSLLKRSGLYHKDFTKRLHNGCLMHVNPSEHVQQSIFWYGYYEKDAVLTWESFINKDSIVMDIGAHTGYYSLIAAPKARMVIAFEPSQSVASRLKQNIDLNGLSNVKTITAAVSDHDGTAKLYISANDNSGMTGLQPAENFSGTIESVPIVRMDSWMANNNIQHVHCIKIDVEGAEMKVLSGMQQLIRSNRPVLFIEVINELLQHFNSNAAEVFKFLDTMGYVGYEVIRPRFLRLLDHPAEAYTIVFLHRDHEVPPGITLQARS